MHPIGTGSQRQVGARVDQQGSFQFTVLGSELVNDVGGCAGQSFQLPRGKVVFTKLDVIDSGADGLGDFSQQAAAARRFVSGKCGAVGDVVEKAGASGSQVVGRGCSAVSRQLAGLPTDLVVSTRRAQVLFASI